MRTFFRALKTISVITLFFFCWTFLPLWQAVAYATEKQKPGVSSQKPGGPQKIEPRIQTAGELFGKALEDIRGHINKAAEKSNKGIEPTEEIAAIKTRKAEIESIDGQLKEEFAASEKKIKEAHLPGEILDRHNKFVKYYQDNLKELIGNLDQVEKAKTKAEIDGTIKKVKLHLDKTKPLSTHKPLDPNKLPHRLVKAKAKKPRINKSDFLKDFPSQKKTNKLASYVSQESASRITAFGDKLIDTNVDSVLTGKPILVASNGSLAGLLSSSSKYDTQNLPFSAPSEPVLERLNREGNDFDVIPNSITPNYQIAQAITNPPTSYDLSETPEVQFTPAIQALATQLNHHPLKIYEWVRNNIEYAPTYGSIQGADQCLQSKICNDMDTASLLIALLRSSGIYAHYVYGTVNIPIDKAMNWVGGVTDPKMAGMILSTNGIPATIIVSGGTIKSVLLEHVWVNAFIDYIPSRGAVQRQGNTWIPLDASYKQYTYTQGIDIQTAVPFDAQSFVNQIQSTATINPDGSVTNVNSALVQQTMQNYQSQVQNYITQNKPNATVGDVIGTKQIIQKNYPILMCTLPYQPVQIGSEFSTVPDNLRETMSFSIPDPTGASAGLTYTTGMPQIAGKKITLSFSPATSADQTTIQSYFPKPHADGSPIQPSELPSSLPAYLINLKAELRIDGQVVATGASATMGSAQPFTISLNEPGIGVSNINNTVQAGEYFGIGLDTGRIGDYTLNSIGSKLAATKVKIDAKNYTGLTEDDLIGDLLYNTIASYFAGLDASDEISAMTFGVIRYRAPSVGMFSLTENVQEIFAIPIGVSSKGMMMDVDRIMQAVFSKEGNQSNVNLYMLVSESNSSVQEHAVPEYLYSTSNKAVQGISAAKALQIANNQGIPIYTINQSNIVATLPQLQVDTIVKTDIQNAVNAGKVVTVSKTNIIFNGTSVCGYIIMDPNTGAGAYMIAGGANGGMILGALSNIISYFLVTEAEAAELDDTYVTQAPVISSPCTPYYHASDFAGCVVEAMASNDFMQGVVTVLAGAAGGLVLAQFLGATVFYVVAILAIVAILAVMGAIMLQCRKTATHC